MMSGPDLSGLWAGKREWTAVAIQGQPLFMG